MIETLGTLESMASSHAIERNRQQVEGLLKVIESAVLKAKLANKDGYANVDAAHCISQMAIDLLKVSVELEQQIKFQDKIKQVVQ